MHCIIKHLGEINIYFLYVKKMPFSTLQIKNSLSQELPKVTLIQALIKSLQILIGSSQ